MNFFYRKITLLLITSTCLNLPIKAESEFVAPRSFEAIPIPVQVPRGASIYRNARWGIVISEVMADGVRLTPSEAVVSGVTGDGGVVKVTGDMYIYMVLFNSVTFYSEKDSNGMYKLYKYKIPDDCKEVIIRYKTRGVDGICGSALTLKALSMDRLMELAEP